MGKWVKAWRQSASDLRQSLEGNFVPTSFIYDPEHWRKRADEARSLADDMKDKISEPSRPREQLREDGTWCKVKRCNRARCSGGDIRTLIDGL